MKSSFSHEPRSTKASFASLQRKVVGGRQTESSPAHSVIDVMRLRPVLGEVWYAICVLGAGVPPTLAEICRRRDAVTTVRPPVNVRSGLGRASYAKSTRRCADRFPAAFDV